MAKSLRRRQLSSQSFRYVAWTRSSTTDREGSPQIDAVRRIVRLIDLPTRATNSSHAALSHGPAQRQTTSCKDSDEYLELGLSAILPCQETGTLPEISVLFPEFLRDIVLLSAQDAGESRANATRFMA